MSVQKFSSGHPGFTKGVYNVPRVLVDYSCSKTVWQKLSEEDDAAGAKKCGIDEGCVELFET